jgi:NitT/TauT family transport system permease protein
VSNNLVGQIRKFIRQGVSLLILLLFLALVWEGAKWIGGDPWRPETNPWGIMHNPPLRWKVASDLNLPHIWQIAEAFSNPARRNGPPLFTILVDAALYTFREALVGFLFGALLGLVLGTLFVHYRLLERGCMPYVVASQTIPILAIAPMVIIWLKAGWLSVAVIAAYLTFFPVTINTLRGLRSPDPRALELMHSYAASPWAILWKLRFPAALPYIFTAFKVSATASVVGAIIGELPSGIRDGLGGAILNFNQYYISGPSRLWATIVVSAVVGIAFYVIILLLERLILHGRQLE